MYKHLVKIYAIFTNFFAHWIHCESCKTLPNHLRNSFYKSHLNIILERNSFVSLEQFEMWLDTKVKEQFNPIANILSIDQPYFPRDHIRSNKVLFLFR